MVYKLYSGDIKDIETKYDDIFNVLPQYRKDKIKKYKNKDDRLLSLLAGYLLHQALIDSNILDLEKNIFIDEYGKQHLPNDEMFFSISHSGTKVYLVISSSNIAIDIEQNSRVVDKLLIDKCFANEKNLIRTNLDAIIFWTIKEAYIKYLGTGLQENLKCINVQRKNDIYSIENDRNLNVDVQFIEDYVITIIR